MQEQELTLFDATAGWEEPTHWIRVSAEEAEILLQNNTSVIMGIDGFCLAAVYPDYYGERQSRNTFS